MTAPRLRVAATVSHTPAEGPHLRFAIWTQGCSIRCPGCCNPEFFRSDQGQWKDVSALVHEIANARDLHGIEGLTVLGGEPLDQVEALAKLALECQSRDLGVIIYTGHSWLRARSLPGFSKLWPAIDTLVDGPFDITRPEPSGAEGGRANVGSTNQRLRHRTTRYDADELWQGPRRAVLQCERDGRVHVHGSPQLVARVRRALAPGSDSSTPS